MGKVRVIPQVDQAGQKSGLELLEITYGGNEAPFGGIDSSAPPAYIDPRCFADADGFLVVDNKLVVASYQLFNTPTLWSGVTDITLLKAGSFYNSRYGQLNYALGYSVTPVDGPPAATLYTFYITAWSASTGTILDNSILNIQLFTTQIAPVAATLTIPVLKGESSDYIDSGSLAINFGASGAYVGTASFGYTPGMTVAQMVAGIIAALNVVSGSSGFTAAPSLDGLSVILTAVNPGAAGNNLQVADASSSTTVGNVPAFYFPAIPNPTWTNLSQGSDMFRNDPPQGPFDISTTEVGGVLYIANIGPFILKYAGPGTFMISSVYNGVRVIKKFAGSLIGLGTISQLGTVLQNMDMIFSWSAANNLDEWSPVDANGNITGAGFAQLADIADTLLGLIVSNNTAFIIRSQGLSYATAIQNGEDPFYFAHIGLGETGEGTQSSDLVCQYDQTGAYVGNSDIFQISGSISAIGAKIKSALFYLLETLIRTGSLSSTACTVFIGGDTYPVVCFMIGETIFKYNPTNQTWMKFFYSAPAHKVLESLVTMYDQNTGRFIQSAPVLALQGKTGIIPVLAAPIFYSLIEGVANINSISGQAQVTFPQEELLLGRDVTIDALYISLWGDVSEDTTLSFYFNGILFGNFVLTSAQFNTLNGAPVEIKIFPSGGTGVGVFTSHSPQLQIKVTSLTDTGTAYIHFAKIQEYASFEPNQRPV